MVVLTLDAKRLLRFVNVVQHPLQAFAYCHGQNHQGTDHPGKEDDQNKHVIWSQLQELQEALDLRVHHQRQKADVPVGVLELVRKPR